MSSVSLVQNQLVEQLTKLKCLETSCGHQIFSTIQSLKLHLLKHTDKKEEITCCFCSYATNTTGTLKSHMSRKHKLQTVIELDPRVVVDVIDHEEQLDVRDEVHDDVHNEIRELCIDVNEISDTSIEEPEDVDSEEIFLKAVAIMVNIPFKFHLSECSPFLALNNLMKQR